MEEFIKDKIFQYYYKKIYGQKSNYQSFKTFSDKDKVSFLINLYLFISNINNKNQNIDSTITPYKEKENTNIINSQTEESESNLFYQENYNKIMNDFNLIMNKYNNQCKENNSNENSLKENNSNNNKEIISNDNIQNKDENQVNSLKNNNKSNKIRNSDNSNPNDVNNSYLENKQKDEKDISNPKNNKTNELSSLQNNINSSKNYQNIDNNIDENQKKITQDKNQKKNNEKLLIKDLVLTNQTITEHSKIDLEEFKDGNIVEKLINCPQNNSISLNCIEANKIALVIINLLETKNDLENEIEEEKKKNEIRLDKLKIDFERQKKNFKLNYDKKEINILDALNKIKSDIEDEKKFLDDNVKSYNLWDKVSIENQRTKEIKESIKKKLETLK